MEREEMTAKDLCPKCGENPKLNNFYVCRDCHNKYQAEWSKNNKDKVIKYNSSWRERNRDKTRESKKRFYLKHNTESKEYQRVARISCKNEVFNHYCGGNICCACCGETAIQFLSIDHINGDGAEKRREIKSQGGAMYSWLKGNGYPEGYQILCFNCNMAKRDKAYCPHKEIGYDTNKNQISKEKIKREARYVNKNHPDPLFRFNWILRRLGLEEL